MHNNQSITNYIPQLGAKIEQKLTVFTFKFTMGIVAGVGVGQVLWEGAGAAQADGGVRGSLQGGQVGLWALDTLHLTMRGRNTAGTAI